MSAEVFLDTNVLVYAAIGSDKDEPKRRRALDLIRSENFATSAQVLQEFYVTVVKKFRQPLATDAASDSESPIGMRPSLRLLKRSESKQSTPRT